MPSGETCGCPEEHEHHPERIWLTLTDQGLRLNILGVFHQLWQECVKGEWEDVAAIVAVMGQLLSAAYRGDDKWLETNYQTAVVSNFRTKLEAVDDITDLLGEGGT